MTRQDTLVRNLIPQATLLIAVLATIGAAGCQSVSAQSEPFSSAGPDLAVGNAQFPDEDAVILRWQQKWTLERDGTVHRRDHKWLKLFNSRPIRVEADPRIDFVKGRDQLIIHKAQSILPDGTILPVPDYSFNIAAPDDVAGWPEYADWQQQVVSFSGIEPGVVLELDYEVITPAGVLPWIEGDLRLNDVYPTVEREITVVVPQDVALHYQIDGAVKVDATEQLSAGMGPKMATYRWRAANLAGAAGEPQSLPWRQRGGRLRFTTCPSPAAWASLMIDLVEKAARPDESIKKFAEAVVEDESDPTERIRKIAKKLHDSFNTLGSAKTLQPLGCRSAPEVLRANYGNTLEAGALYLAAVRSLGIDAAVAVGVDADRWGESDKTAPNTPALADVVIVANLADGAVYLRPQAGLFKNPGSWGRHWLLSTDDTGRLQTTYIYARGEREPSELQITGKIAVNTDGEATGELRVRLTGAFFEPADLETSDAQDSFISKLAGRVLTDFKDTSHSVVTLSDDLFRATVNVASDGTLESMGKLHSIKLGDGCAALPDFPMPLAQSRRLTDVDIRGRFRELVDLTIELPDDWAASVVPASLGPIEGKWGSVTQSVDVEGKTIRFRRSIEVSKETIPASEFNALREAVNDLRAAKSLLLAFGKGH